MAIAEGRIKLCLSEEALVVLLGGETILVRELRSPVRDGLRAELGVGRLLDEHGYVVAGVPLPLLEALLLEAGRQVMYMLHAEAGVPAVAEVWDDKPRGHLLQPRHAPLRDQPVQVCQLFPVPVLVVCLDARLGIAGSRAAPLNSALEGVAGAARVPEALHLLRPPRHPLDGHLGPNHGAREFHHLPRRSFFPLDLFVLEPAPHLPDFADAGHSAVVIERQRVHLQH
mmetsp:Transcript_86729/g.245933  ORF Transcript_86729/g.245933 Transcript_86729/m.245933 type:complete len:227 (+) Transcript_86729:735-1415(+)